MGKVRTTLACSSCGQQVGQWVGRCPGCGDWGTIEERGPGAAPAPVPTLSLGRAGDAVDARRAPTGFAGIDRVLGGGIVPGTVALLAGEPGIGKSTLLLQLVANLSAAGLPCLLASGEESREQIAMRAARLGVDGDDVAFVPGRDLVEVLQAARSSRPFLLAVDSIQTLRDVAATQAIGSPAQVRGCADALVGLAKSHGIAVLMTGHVTKDGDLAGPRTLEHAVDVVLTFEGDARSGLRVLSGGKNRFGADGEVAWFEMEAARLREIDPSNLLLGTDGEPGSATALPRAGRRALAVEIHALAVPTESPGRRQVTGLDPRRFQLVAAVLERLVGLSVARSDLFGATTGGVRVDDPACDLGVAAALTSAVTGVPAPSSSAFVGEVTLTGLVRPAPALPQRVAAARGAGIRTVFGAGEARAPSGLRFVQVTRVDDALAWAAVATSTSRPRRSA